MQVKNTNGILPTLVIIFTFLGSFAAPLTSRTDFDGANLNFVVFHVAILFFSLCGN